eukprot:2944239-Rhodomonas_salina.1
MNCRTRGFDIRRQRSGPHLAYFSTMSICGGENCLQADEVIRERTQMSIQGTIWGDSCEFREGKVGTTL